jgi:hypothetical protein
MGKVSEGQLVQGHCQLRGGEGFGGERSKRGRLVFLQEPFQKRKIYRTKRNKLVCVLYPHASCQNLDGTLLQTNYFPSILYSYCTYCSNAVAEGGGGLPLAAAGLQARVPVTA